MSMQTATEKTSAVSDSKAKLARLVKLPPLPPLLKDTLKYTGNNPNLSKLVEKIGHDPPMVLRILRIANSPFYGMSREIGSLREAIVLLGSNRVIDLLLGVCFSSILPVQHKDFNYALFWRRNLAVADCTRQLAVHTGIGEDIAFIAGLLNDIGVLAIVLLFPDEFSRIVKEPEPHKVETERRIMGIDHVEIGSSIAKLWNLPVAIQEAIEQHETPPAQGAAVTPGLLVYTANFLIAASEQADDSGLPLQESIDNALCLLGISVEQAKSWACVSLQFADQILAMR